MPPIHQSTENPTWDNMKRVLVAVTMASMLFAGIAYASNWVELATISSYSEPRCSTKISIETASWSHHDSIVTAWSMNAYGPTQTTCPSKINRQVKYLSEYNCATRMSRGLAYQFTSWSGKISTGNLSGDWYPVLPGTVGQGEFNFVCAHLPPPIHN